MTTDAILAPLAQLVGSWTTEATHPSMPGVIVRGTVDVEWLEGEHFLIHRARSEHPDFPDSISIIGLTGQDRVNDVAAATSGADDAQLRMHYYDSRGVFRVYDVDIGEKYWRLSRDAPEFSQRYSGAITDSGDTIKGVWQLNRDNGHWADDLAITYRRR